MRGSRNFRQGGPGQSYKVPEGVQHFPGGSSFFQGGGSNFLFPIETHITCDFPGGGGVRTPCPPSGSALAFSHVSSRPFCEDQRLIIKLITEAW